MADINEKYIKNIDKLSDFEKYVIVYKGTERAFSSALLEEKREGVFKCKLCGAPLFKSSSKFNSGTGWPSFDDAIDGAVKELLDADGRRTEIVCANCGAHLGHIFRGEGFTPKMARYCVNGVSLKFEEDS